MTDRWYRFERRVEANTRKALDLLDGFNVSATFFVLGVIADEMPTSCAKWPPRTRGSQQGLLASEHPRLRPERISKRRGTLEGCP